MKEPKTKRNDVTVFSLRPLSSVHSEEGRRSPHRKPLRLTISVEKIDRVLADIQKQVEDLQREMTNLRLVRNQLAECKQEDWGDEEQAPFIHSTFIGVQEQSQTAFENV